VSSRWARAGALALAALLAGCAGSGAGKAGSKAGADGRPVAVLYAASLEHLMEAVIAPAFDRAGGYRLEGFAGGSDELVGEIRAGVRRADVLISASPAANRTLERPGARQRVSWYVTFASAPLVFGYNPSSPIAAQLRRRPWYEVITQPRWRIGRTDPKLDPKGALTVQALSAAAEQLRRPALAQAISRFETFPEAALVGRLQAGQLDGGFFYANEATEAGIPSVALSPVHLGATFTITVPAGAPDRAGAQALVAYLLGGRGRATLAAHGLRVLPLRLSGSAAALSPQLRALLAGR
jgi:molybdate/tungstate transport system substrate-binding protein